MNGMESARVLVAVAVAVAALAPAATRAGKRGSTQPGALKSAAEFARAVDSGDFDRVAPLVTYPFSCGSAGRPDLKNERELRAVFWGARITDCLPSGIKLAHAKFKPAADGKGRVMQGLIDCKAESCSCLQAFVNVAFAQPGGGKVQGVTLEYVCD